MNEDFKRSFDLLDINKKRNQISNELIIICELIKNMESYLGIHNEVIKVKDYDEAKNIKLTESEMLSFFYEDIYNIQRELITIFTAMDYNK